MRSFNSPFRNINTPYNEEEKGRYIMFKKQLTVNIEDLDLKIRILTEELALTEDDDKYNTIIGKIDKLTEIRCKLAESKVNGSLTPVVVSGLMGIASLVIVLKFEKAEIITSKAFNMVPNLFRGSK